MTTYKLYVKTHQQTGLKYLGYTSKFDPHKYTGSGKYWKRHLKEHGFDYDTQVLHESSDKNEIAALGTYYSYLWNIVESNDWANLKPESGDGAAFGIHNPMKNQEVLAKQQEIINRPEIKEKHQQQTKRAMNNPLTIAKLKLQRNTPEYKEKLKTTLNKPRDTSGELNGNYNKNRYKFRHIDGTVIECTPFELTKQYNLTSGAASRLIRGQYKITKGWTLG